MALFHSERGSVNYTIVGNPTIIDGVVSGFSSDDYLDLIKFPGFNGDYEFQVALTKTGTGSAGNGILVGRDYLYGGFYQSGGHIIFGFRTTEEGTVTYSLRQTHTLELNVPYVANAKRVGNTLTMKIFKNGVLEETLTGDLTGITASSNIPPIRIGRNVAGAFIGFIDLNNTYIKMNGQPWFGICPIEVKHLTYRAPVDYVVAGDVVVSDGVLTNVTGTGTEAYVDAIIPDFNKFELVTKLGYLNDVVASNSYIPICCFGTGANSVRKITWTASSSNGLYFDVASDNTYASALYNSDFDFATKFNLNGYIFAKFLVEKVGENYNYTVYGSTDGVNWTAGNTYTDSTNWLIQGHNRKVYLLKNSTGSASGYPKMFLSETYIKIDDKLWFYHPATDYVKANDKLVFADSGLNLSGPVNYTVVGSPVIEDGVMSNIDENNYVVTSSVFDISSNFKLHLKINDFAGTGHAQYCLSLYGDATNRIGFYFGNSAVSLTANYGSGSGSYWSVASGLTAGVPLEIEVSGDGTDLTVKTTHGQTTNTASKSLSELGLSGDVEARFGRYSTTLGFTSGKIDLKETYIIVGDALWFYGKNYATQNIAPVPAGYPIGNTTTSAIGWVDMRTQTFTAAPSGAVLAKDEVSAESES